MFTELISNLVVEMEERGTIFSTSLSYTLVLAGLVDSVIILGFYIKKINLIFS